MSREEDDMELDSWTITDQALELAERARSWVVGNPLASMGVAMATGFLMGRTMRMLVLRP